MLRVLGSRKTLCDGISRRDLLSIGSLSMLGLNLADFLRVGEAQAASASSMGKSFGKAKACILLFPFGSPAQHETFDPKPLAPVEIQGTHKAISTSVPGVEIAEGLPKIAKVMDRVTLVRSMTHPYPVHGVAYAITGIAKYTPDIEQTPRDARHWPFIGSVVDYLAAHGSAAPLPSMPGNIAMPWLLGSKTNLAPYSGPYAAFLGPSYDPVWTDFSGPATTLSPRNHPNQKRQFYDPFLGITPAGRFGMSAATLPDDMPAARVHGRRALLEQFDRTRAAVDTELTQRPYDKFREMAFSLLTSDKLRSALDVAREPAQLREAYGMTLFGQACLAARRLVEAGSKFVTVFWDLFGEFSNGAWDTHQYHYQRLRYLLPGLDAAYSALITDLDRRGMLDDTLVILMSEHGRTPKLDESLGGGRQHWSRAYSAALAGGGVKRGHVVGSTDRLGGDVRDTPVSPKDILATTYHLLGIDPHGTVPNLEGRPMPIAGSDANVRTELIA